MEEKTVQEAEEIFNNDNDPWTRQIIDMLGNEENGRHLSIYRVPSKLRNVKEDAYNPRLVSIGPLHRNDANLLAMKEHKLHYMVLILQQTDLFVNTIKCLKACTDAFYDSGRYPFNKKVRESYAVDLTKIEDRDLAEMMLVDGCFILQLFLKNHQSCDQANDPIFSSAWMLPTLRHDLTLLENQIPFFILETLYRIIHPHIVKYTPPDSVTTLALKFFQPMYQQEITQDTDTAGEAPPSSGHIIVLGGPAKPSNQQTIKEGTDTEDYKHLLHLLHNFFRPSLSPAEAKKTAKPSNQQTKKEVRPTEARKKIKNKLKYCASDLCDTGVQFEPGSTDDQLLSIKFRGGVIKIPPLFIDDTTGSLFRNLIAFEQCHLKSSQHITSYVIFMKSLIRSKKDIKLLQKKGIIHQNVARGKYFVQFEGILDGVAMKNFHFRTLCAEVNAYTTRYWFRRKIKDLYRTYFSTAWSTILFSGSILALILSSFQTYFTIYPREY